MLALAQIGIGLQVVALTMVGVLTLRPADADPGTSRAILDLSELLAGISGAALALAMIAMALGIRRTPGLLPARFSEAALVVAVGVALWTVRLFSDAESFDAYSILGSSLGWTLLIAWVLAAGVWLLAIRPRRAVLPPAGEAPSSRVDEVPSAAAPPPQAPRPQTREERVAERMPPRASPPRPPAPPSSRPAAAAQPVRAPSLSGDGAARGRAGAGARTGRAEPPVRRPSRNWISRMSRRPDPAGCRAAVRGRARP